MIRAPNTAMTASTFANQLKTSGSGVESILDPVCWRASEPSMVAHNQQSRRGGHRDGFAFVSRTRRCKRPASCGMSKPAVKRLVASPSHSTPPRRGGPTLCIARQHFDLPGVVSGKLCGMPNPRRFQPRWSIEDKLCIGAWIARHFAIITKRNH
jgi:hypothetical protein